MKIGVILPSRGLVFAETMSALLENLKGYEYKIYFSWDLKIPDCQNVLVDRALADRCDFILFVEEDTVMPDGAIDDMIMAQADIACIDYGVNEWSCITRDRNSGEIWWCGLGCTLVKRSVFEGLVEPYFRSDKALLLNYWPQIKWIDAGAQAYGGQDIYFCINARKAGFTIKQVGGECKHLRLEGLGRPEINNGLHNITVKPTIKKRNVV